MVLLLEIPEEMIRYLTRFLCIKEIKNLSMCCKLLYNILLSYLLEHRVKKNMYSIIIRASNDKHNLPLIFCLLVEYLGGAKLNYEIIIIDDGSSDETLEVGVKLQNIYGNEKIVLLNMKWKMALIDY